MTRRLTGRMLHEAYLASLVERQEFDRDWEDLRPELRQRYEDVARRLNAQLFPTQLPLFESTSSRSEASGK